MVGLHQWHDGDEFEQALGVGDAYGSLEYCNPWGLKESDMTEWLNWTELKWRLKIIPWVENQIKSQNVSRFLYKYRELDKAKEKKKRA